MVSADFKNRTQFLRFVCPSHVLRKSPPDPEDLLVKNLTLKWQLQQLEFLMNFGSIPISIWMNHGQHTPHQPSRLAKYADLFDRVADCTFLLDPNSFIVLEANPACERVLGVTMDKFLGRSLIQWIEDAEKEDFGKALRISRRRYYPRQFETRFQSGDQKSLIMEVLSCCLSLSDHTDVIQVVARDVTFRREAEQRMQALLAELQVANKRLEELSVLDEMTGLYNFRHFSESLEKEHIRARRYNTPYVIVFCDLDKFKNYNDNFGHPTGDKLLKVFAEVVRKSIRNTDLPARYGGDEFAIICPGINWEGGRTLGERIRTAMEQATFDFLPDGTKVTASVGIASFPEDAKTADAILQAADEALYTSKKAGRNRVTTYYLDQILKKEVA